MSQQPMEQRPWGVWCSACDAPIPIADWASHFQAHSPEARKEIEQHERDRQKAMQLLPGG